jgi:hypothetical protein
MCYIVSGRIPMEILLIPLYAVIECAAPLQTLICPGGGVLAHLSRLLRMVVDDNTSQRSYIATATTTNTATSTLAIAHQVVLCPRPGSRRRRIQVQSAGLRRGEADDTRHASRIAAMKSTRDIQTPPKRDRRGGDGPRLVQNSNLSCPCFFAISSRPRSNTIHPVLSTGLYQPHD